MGTLERFRLLQLVIPNVVPQYCQRVIRGRATLTVVLANFGVFHINMIQNTLIGMKDFRAQFAMELVAVFTVEMFGVVFVSVRFVL